MTDPDLDLLCAGLPHGRLLFVNAAPCPALAAARGRVACVQRWKPAADALAAAGFETGDSAGRYDAALVRLGRQRDVNRANLAAALDALGAAGELRVAGPNALGAASYGKDLRALGLAPVSTSKGKARLFVAPRGAADPSAWRRLADPRPILDGRFVSAPGVFAWDRIDPGSALLAGLLPGDLAGRVADLGAGFGFLSDAVLRGNPGVARLDAYEADAVAAGCAGTNLAAFGARAQVHWHDVAAGIGTGAFDAIVANPPFHDPGGEDRSLGLRFVEVAAGALKPNGRLLLVANRHLPYEATLRARFARVELRLEERGYKVYAASA